MSEYNRRTIYICLALLFEEKNHYWYRMKAMDTVKTLGECFVTHLLHIGKSSIFVSVPGVMPTRWGEGTSNPRACAMQKIAVFPITMIYVCNLLDS